MSTIKGTAKVGDFSRAMGETLKNYNKFVEDELKEVTEKLAKDAAKELQTVSRSTFKTKQDKPYNKGWAAKNESVRYHSRWIIHNRTKPGLAHLLEHGHANVNGGRTPGRIHIKPIEEKLQKEYLDAVESALKTWGD